MFASPYSEMCNNIYLASSCAFQFYVQETKRRQLAEAAEKRQKESTHRGIKNPEAVERKKKKQEEIEKQAMSTSTSGGGGLRWQVG
ncbi:small VCP/p97-interacting protein isoform X1 [Silurus meridionalis]|uniref:small VCP/p97-interacting protein isoform X1 n=1 Tax=Silurus meridionalis TaxID=175797 RepID=UPI001EEA635C|nr:small VCP/p97-interacting protein isoform X1 [Silurus meridionalis]